MRKLQWIILIVCIAAAKSGGCQSTVFSIMQDRQKLADQNFSEGNYAVAIELYNSILVRNAAGQATRIKLGQSYYYTKNYRQAVSQYDDFLREGGTLSIKDRYLYAECHLSLKNYLVSLNSYKECLKAEPDNDLIAKKIWRIDNLHYLFEDSSNYALRFLNINTTSGELYAVVNGNEIVFTSNRRLAQAVEEVDGSRNTPFYQLYMSSWKKDSTIQWGSELGKPSRFAGTIKARFNTGPVAFFKKHTQMVFVASSEKSAVTGRSTLGLYFATKEDGQWEIVSSFPYNSTGYSIKDVTINEDGTKMFFSSDMKGGYGSTDIYSSQWKENKWSKPLNLGENINTSQDEVSPYLQADGNLYFSSNGQPGMGGLDIFKAEVKDDGFSEPQNMGYPLNSSFDDLGISIDSLGLHGYFTSNRKHGGYDDDVYEFDTDLQSYPILITGVIKFQEHTLTNERAIQKWPLVRFSVVDSWRGKSVFQSATDKDGHFSITIPYFSKFFLQIVDETGVEHKVSLEIEKYKKEASSHEIVVVKDIFTQNDLQKN